MSMKIVRTSLASVATVFALAFAGLANGALFGSHFDPETFVGDALFKFNDSCLADGIYTGPACNVQILSATADFTDGSNGGHLDFASVLPSLPSSTFTIDVSGGNLVGVSTDLIGWVFADPGCTGALCYTPWWIQWSMNPQTVSLFTGSCDGDVCFPHEIAESVAPNVTFTRIPEPGTLFLVAGALFAAWLSRRRST